MNWIRIQAANRQEVYSINFDTAIKIHETNKIVEIYFDKDTCSKFSQNKGTGIIEVDNEQWTRLKGAIAALAETPMTEMPKIRTRKLK